MTAPKSSPASGPISSNQPRTFQARPGLVETVFPARITVAFLKEAFGEIERLGAGPVWFADGTATTSFETACIPLAGVELIRLKKKGLKRIVMATQLSSLRMAASAVGLTSGLNIRVVERRLEALPLLAPSD